MNNGGPVFPKSVPRSRFDTDGMTLRAFYKAAALSLLGNARVPLFESYGTGLRILNVEALAREAGRLADAMIAEDVNKS